MVYMKTTVEIQDQIFARAQRKALRDGRTMRSLIEEGLLRCLEADQQSRQAKYELADLSVGDPRGPNPLEAMSWPEIRDEIYGGR
jgi:hypothetical protein